MSALDAKILLRAADLVDAGWCQGAIALGEFGEEVRPDSPLATKWSLYGAVSKASAELGHELSIATFDQLRPGDWQDEPGRTATEVAAHVRDVAQRVGGAP